MLKTKKEKYIFELIDKYRKIFQVENHEFDVVFADKKENMPLADIDHEQNYQRITIKIYPILMEKGLNDIRETLIHEFCHILTDPICNQAHNLFSGKFVTQEQIMYNNEMSTSMIANILKRYV